MTRIALLSTYPPTQCGLATFSAALHRALLLTSTRVGVISVVEESSPGPWPREVVTELVNSSGHSATATMRTLNGYDAVIVQHEYGIYGGADGVEVLDILEALTVPTIIVLHTVLAQPTPGQRQVLQRLIAAGSALVTMTETGRRRLVQLYDADPDLVTVIPHGASEHLGAGVAPPRDPRPLILTWGLLGPGKGIEWAIDAMVALRDLDPRYLVVGRTHPKVLEHDGESYRRGLTARARSRDVDDLVEIDPTYLDPADLAGLLAAADVVLLPYDSTEQVTSGVLIEAVAAGRPVVSTAFPHAVELLAGGSGLTVPRQNPGAIAAAVRRVLSEPELAGTMAAQAARQAPALAWGAVAESYRKLAETLIADRLVADALVADALVGTT